VELVPDDTWGGAGLLGVTIRLDNYAGAEERLIRVLSVEDQSPAAVAGLVPLKDFLLGTAHQTLETTQTLAQILYQYEDRVVELYVYNCDSDLVRVVALMPTLSWGGRGLLGAEVGVGYLHRLPHTVRNTEGASVERKVRYVVATDGAGVGGVQQQSSGPSGNAAGSKGRGGVGGTVLEMEPQLEMEPDEERSSHDEDGDDDEDDDDGDVSADMSSVALNEPAASPTERKRPTPEEGNCEASTRSNGGGAETTTKTITAALGGGGMLPPPPKMHYDTPPRTTEQQQQG